MLIALSRKDEIRKAQSNFSRCLRVGAKVYDRKLGWHGGDSGGPVKVHWHPEYRFWSHVSGSSEGNRYWVVFGTQDPADTTGALTLTCEINVPFSGVDRKVAGAFARSDDGTPPSVFITHSGKIGGGRKGVGKVAFLKHWRGQEQRFPILGSDSRTSETILVASLNEGNCVAQIGHFVHEVQRIKALLVTEARSRPSSHLVRQSGIVFTPEFKGTRFYTKQCAVVSRCNHGLIIDALHLRLQATGLKTGNDQRDLFVVNRRGTVTAVFEAKTTLMTTDLYAAIGQLFYYTSLEPQAPLRILVIPGNLKDSTRKRLNRIGIELVDYSLSNGRVTFQGIESILEKLASSR